MGRDDLSITIPTLFRCPISLDVMTSPVTLSTGVTYNRSSIQRWLDTGHNTCPTTMQVLENQDLVPNFTLQRLIQIWSSSAAATSPKSVASITQDEARGLIEQIKLPNYEFDNRGCSYHHVSKLIVFAVESDENRKFLAYSVDGFVPLLIKILGFKSRNFQFGEKVIQLCGIVLTENRDAAKQSAKLDKDRIGFMIQLLQRECLESKIAAARVLEILAGDSTTKIFITEQAGILPELLKQVSTESDSVAIEAYLSCLISLSSPKRTRVRIVCLGAVKTVAKTLSNDSPAVVVEKALKLLELVSTCKEGRYEICENGDCIKVIVMKMLKVSRSVTEVVVAILWSLCCLFREERAREAVMKNNGVGKILVLIQSDCSPAVRQMSSDLLRVFKVNSKACISSYETMTTHIAPF